MPVVFRRVTIVFTTKLCCNSELLYLIADWTAAAIRKAVVNLSQVRYDVGPYSSQGVQGVKSSLLPKSPTLSLW